jgi:hypothetical protein
VSYLHPVRLHFAGRFRADVSTVNNDPQHFDNQNFTPNFQLPGNANCSWQPAGTGRDIDDLGVRPGTLHAGDPAFAARPCRDWHYALVRLVQRIAVEPRLNPRWRREL